MTILERPLILLFIGGLILTLGDILMKKWVILHQMSWYVWGLLLYFIALNFLAQSFRTENIAVASLILILVNVITLSIVNWLYFKEPLNSYQMVGMVLGLASVTLLELAHGH